VTSEPIRHAYDLSRPIRDLWTEWQRHHPEIELGAGDAKEQRFDIFANNVHRIRELNSQPGPRFMLNKYAHMSEDEFSARIFNSKMPNDFSYNSKVDSMLPLVSPHELAALPVSFDWRTHKPPVVTRVKDQGACGDCWAFSTTGNVEGQWALAGHPLVELSEQNLCDCDHVCINNVCDSGCDGGLMANAFTYIIKNKGIDTEKSYPYEGYNGKCKFSAANVGATITNFTFIPHNAAQMQYYVVNQGPISIAADATMWQFYYSGVWYFPCGTSLDHGILIVGYGVETDYLGQKMPYWIVKNSWGADWGMNGYILIERGDNRCGLQQYPITSVVSK